MEREYGFYKTRNGCLILAVGILSLSVLLVLLAIWVKPSVYIIALIIACAVSVVVYFSYKRDNR